jgi:serine/arginine repetitive matrix protein 2
MYNGIGLTTPRGSGTSGYVQKNLAAVKKFKPMTGNYKEVLQKFKENPVETKKRANLDIIEHEKKRKIEAELYVIAEVMRKQGTPEDEVNTKINELREIKAKSLNNVELE